MTNYIEISKLNPNEDNPRKISFKKLESLCESIKNNAEYFEARPIICDKNLTIWAGNSRFKAAQKLGLKKVPVHIIDLPEEKMREIMIRDNVNNGEWDTSLLADWDFGDLENFGLEINWSKTIDNRENDFKDSFKKDLEPIKSVPNDFQTKQPIAETGDKKPISQAKISEAVVENHKTIVCPHCEKTILL